LSTGTGAPLPDLGRRGRDATREGPDPAADNDGLLVPFLSAQSIDEAGAVLGNLLQQHVRPVVQGIVRRRLRLAPGASWGGEDAEDLVGEAIAKLVARLQALRDHGSPDGKSATDRISDLRAYTATVASSVCEEHLRRKYPERRRLKNRVQYLLTHRADFDLWEADDGEWYGGFEAWRGRCSRAGWGERLRRLRDHMAEFEQAALGGRRASQQNPFELVSAVFRWVGGPVELDELVSLLRDLWEIHEEVVSSFGSESELERHAAQPAGGPDVADRLDQRNFLSRLWSEICELPRRQRSAVLLNLRDEKGCSAIELFPLLGVVTIRQIAAALEIPAEEFAGLWNELPLDDTRIAARVGVTRQQVINLRKSARERISRHVRDG
jgi:DNA-directed RNA polymerase specialized sigma24 family protein